MTKRKAIDRVLTLIRELEHGMYKPRELSQKTKIPLRTIYRILEKLEAYNLVFNENGEYTWHENRLEFENYRMYEKALKHSSELASSMEHFIAISFIEDSDSPRFELHFKNPYGKYMFEHIFTGYPKIRRILEEFKRLEGKKEGELDIYLRYAIKISYDDNFKPIYPKIADDIRNWIIETKLKIAHGIPLKGRCELCPNITFKNIQDH